VETAKPGPRVVRQVLDAAGQQDVEAGAATLPLGHPGAAAMKLGEPGHQREADAHAAPVAKVSPRPTPPAWRVSERSTWGFNLARMRGMALRAFCGKFSPLAMGVSRSPALCFH
jgi:hypothetical protein